MERAARQALDDAMRRLADGDRGAMVAVHEAVVPRVRALCARMLGDGADVADVVQQVLIDLFERASDFDPDRDALSWALTIAVWHCRTERKRRARRRSVALDERELESRDASPESAVIAAADREAFTAAVGSLGERDREVLEAILGGAPLSAALRKRKERMLVRLRRILLGEEPTS